MTPPFDARLDQSCRWIKKHWDAFNVDVPDELLREWTQSDHLDGPPPSGFHLAVFTFGYLQYLAIHSKTAHEGVPPVPAAKILDLYYQWQVKLALACVDRRTEIRTSALRLFAFSEDEGVEIMLRDDQNTRRTRRTAS